MASKTSQRDPHEPRDDDPPAVAQWRTRMATDEANAIYKQRAEAAECVNAIARNRGPDLTKNSNQHPAIASPPPDCTGRSKAGNIHKLSRPAFGITRFDPSRLNRLTSTRTPTRRSKNAVCVKQTHPSGYFSSIQAGCRPPSHTDKSQLIASPPDGPSPRFHCPGRSTLRPPKNRPHQPTKSTAPLPQKIRPLPTSHCPLPTSHCPLPTSHCPTQRTAHATGFA